MPWDFINEYTITDGDYIIGKYFVKGRPVYILWDKYKKDYKDSFLGQFNTSGDAQMRVEALKDSRIIHPQEE